ncbi:hypothetical protein AHF37_11636 [Paragonimus kellicotti]|nr:hypothetical protein AHF37_11636 [Paragonimus kellicotti]
MQVKIVTGIVLLFFRRYSVRELNGRAYCPEDYANTVACSDEQATEAEDVTNADTSTCNVSNTSLYKQNTRPIPLLLDTKTLPTPMIIRTNLKETFTVLNRDAKSIEMSVQMFLPESRFVTHVENKYVLTTVVKPRAGCIINTVSVAGRAVERSTHKNSMLAMNPNVARNITKGVSVVKLLSLHNVNKTVQEHGPHRD